MKIINAIRSWRWKKAKAQTVLELKGVHRMWIFITPFGLGYLALLLVLLIWAINYQLSLGYFFIFFLFFFLLHSAVSCAHHLAYLRLRALNAPDVFAGEKAFFSVECAHIKGRTFGGFSLANAEGEVFCPVQEKGNMTHLTLAQQTHTRGMMSVLPMQLATTLPLGLVVSWRWFRLKADVIVYPKPAGNLPLPSNLQANTPNEGRAVLGTEEWHDLRTYQLGDPLSRIHWKRRAKNQELLVRTFADTLNQERILLDYQTLTGDKEERLSQLCAWIVQCDKSGREYALRLPHMYFDFAQGKTHYQNCLRALAVMP